MNAVRLSGGPDAAAVELVEELIDRLQAGADAEALIAEHPEHADTLRRLLPAVRMMADLSRSGDARIDLGDDGRGELGDFRLVREVGRGGMGVVYEAVQISLNRRVALKVLPFAATMDPRQLQRFRHEAQAAAMLHHANIVPVYGVGCERGVHYFAMQLIEGRSLAAVIDELRGPASSGDHPHTPTGSTGAYSASGANGALGANGASGDGAPTAPVRAAITRKTGAVKAHFRPVAELIAQAADALEFAHSMGVVHRDIKPANLMLDAGGHLWVTDFGLAKLDTAANLTVSGDLLGTLRYMSPEQALARHGLVDHRTDVYSLGATLYELLTLRPAVGGEDKHEILRQIAFEEPIAPRKLDKAIPAELETVTLKALAKNPADRYATAGELATDLRRWLDDKTIQAKPPTLRQRAWKWVRRHRAVAWSAAIILLVAALMFAGSVGYVANERATRQAAAERVATDALSEADRWEQRAKWADALSAAKRAADALGDAGVGALASETRRRRDDLALVQRLEEIRLECWDYADDDLSQHTAADQFYATAFCNAGFDIDTLTPEEVARRMPVGPIREEMVAALDDWARVRRGNRQRPNRDDNVPWQRILAAAHAADPDPQRNRLRELWSRKDEAARKEAVAMARSPERRRRNTALLLYQLLSSEDGIAVLREAQRQQPADFQLNNTLGTLLSILEPVTPAKVSEAVGFYRAALALRPDDARVLARMGNAMARRNWSHQVLDEGIAILERAAKLNPDYPPAQRYLGRALVRRGRMDDALDVYRDLLRIEPLNQLNYRVLSKAFVEKRSFDEAIAAQRKATALAPNLGFLWDELGGIHMQRKAWTEAIAAYSEAIRVEPDDGYFHCHLGLALKDAGRLQEALVALRRGHELGSKHDYWREPSASWVAECEAAIASAASGVRPNTAEVETAKKAWEARRAQETQLASWRVEVRARPNNPVVHNALAWVLATSRDPKLRDPAEAVRSATRATELKPDEAAFWNTLGVAQFRASDSKAAVAALEQSMKLGNGGDAHDWFFLAMARWQLGEREVARELYDKAARWAAKNAPNDEELNRFHSEAAKLLGVPTKPDP